uniref:Variant surface glycoprotein 1758 n=1 Tax=Trypanosoma brucei TaxID=5691 RepID=M4SW80_9TRYP|nr:variant surface glycoprotein 1758 [Trypanosoma brucei]
MLLILTTLVLILFSGARPNDELANLPDFRVICRIVQHAAAGFENPAATIVPDPEQLAALTSKLAILNDNNETRFKDEKTRTAHGITGKEQRFNAKQGAGHLRVKLLKLENVTKQLAAEAASNKTEIEKATEDANNLLAESVYGEGATFKESADPARAITNERKDKLFGHATTINEKLAAQPEQAKAKTQIVGITLANDIYCLCLIGATTTKILRCDDTGSSDRNTAVDTGKQLARQVRCAHQNLRAKAAEDNSFRPHGSNRKIPYKTRISLHYRRNQRRDQICPWQSNSTSNRMYGGRQTKLR